MESVITPRRQNRPSTGPSYFWGRTSVVSPSPQTPEDAWGSPALFGRKIFGSTPTPTSDKVEAGTRGCGEKGGSEFVPETEEDFVEYYQDKINNAHNRQLYPLQEDLADWINKTLGLSYLTGGNLLDMLDNGVLLCQLARTIQQKAEQTAAVGNKVLPLPTISARCFKEAPRRSFFSRDNMEKFIQFCKKLGVHQHLLFESDDLVLQNQPRNVILCLMEVSRLAVKYGVEPPGLVKFEREIAEEEKQESQYDSALSHDSLGSSWHLQESPELFAKPQRFCSSTTEICNGSHITEIADSSSVQRPESAQKSVNGKDYLRRTISDGNYVDADHGNIHRVRSRTLTDDQSSRTSSEDYSESVAPEDLDRKVKRATHVVRRQCRCSEGKCDKLKVKKVGEGRYVVAGKNVFIRLLKGRHMMVRVGGGWDTLENFLSRHDPCQSSSRSVSRTNSPVPSQIYRNGRRQSSTPHYSSSTCSISSR